MRIVLVATIAAASLVAQGPPPRFGRGFGPPMGRRGDGAGRVVTGAPFSAQEITVTQQTLAGGNLIQRQEQTNLYRDSEGRLRTESTVQRPNRSSVTRVTVTDPVAGVRRTIDADSRTVTEFPLRAPGNGIGAGRGQGRQRQTNDPNVVSESLGTQTINGVVANGTRVTRTIPAGAVGNVNPIQVIQETWRSSDLGLAVMVKTSDPRSGVTVRQLTNINRAEPDAALFQAPPGYTVKQAAGRGRPGAALQ